MYPSPPPPSSSTLIVSSHCHHLKGLPLLLLIRKDIFADSSTNVWRWTSCFNWESHLESRLQDDVVETTTTSVQTQTCGSSSSSSSSSLDTNITEPPSSLLLKSPGLSNSSINVYYDSTPLSSSIIPSSASASSSKLLLRLALSPNSSAYTDGTTSLTDSQIQQACTFIEEHISISNGKNKRPGGVSVLILAPQMRPEEAMYIFSEHDWHRQIQW